MGKGREKKKNKTKKKSDAFLKAVDLTFFFFFFFFLSKPNNEKITNLYISHSFFLRTKNTIFSPPEQGYTICYFCSIFYFLESGRVQSVKLGIGIYF